MAGPWWEGLGSRAQIALLLSPEDTSPWGSRKVIVLVLRPSSLIEQPLMLAWSWPGCSCQSGIPHGQLWLSPARMTSLLEKAHTGLIHLPSLSPVAQGLSPVPAHNPGLRSAREGASVAACSPVASGEETEESAITLSSAGLSSTSQGRNGGGKARGRVSLIHDPPVVLGASMTLSVTGSLGAVGPLKAGFEPQTPLDPGPWVWQVADRTKCLSD